MRLVLVLNMLSSLNKDIIIIIIIIIIWTVKSQRDTFTSSLSALSLTLRSIGSRFAVNRHCYIECHVFHNNKFLLRMLQWLTYDAVYITVCYMNLLVIF